MRKVMLKQSQPSLVNKSSRQDGEAGAEKWAWVEATVWTERMLKALGKGVKGGKWFSLMDKVYVPANLEAAWKKVKRNRGAAGVDGQSVKKFSQRVEQELELLHQQLKAGQYQPRDVLRVWIDKPGTKKQRPLGIPTVRDRVVQTALRQVIEPIFEAKFMAQSYGFRPGRGCKDALRRVSELLEAGYHWVVDADIVSYFDRIDHKTLKEELSQEIADGTVLQLIDSYLNQKVLEGVKTWQPEQGTPQGAVISPLMANVYLHPVDQVLWQEGYQIIRYADDLVVLCGSRQEAEAALKRLGQLIQARGLELHSEKTRLVDASQAGGFDFLGYHFERGKRWPRKRSIQQLRQRIRSHTRRTNGHSLQQTIDQLNPILRGWFEYFKHGRPYCFRDIDGWVRMRLRSILRKRRGGRGRGRGADHQRWAIAFFREQGLFTLSAAHDSLYQSRCGPH